MSSEQSDSRDEGVAGVAASDSENAFYREIAERLRPLVRRICSPSLAHRHDDIVQAALVKIMKLTRSSKGKREFTASYLWKTAYSAMIDEIRSIRRRAEVPIESDDGDPLPLPADHPGPEATSRGAEIRRAFSACLEKMVEARRTAMILHLQGHSVSEAAALLDWDYKRVENLLYRGKQHLRLCLEGLGLAP